MGVILSTSSLGAHPPAVEGSTFGPSESANVKARDFLSAVPQDLPSTNGWGSLGDTKKSKKHKVDTPHTHTHTHTHTEDHLYEH